MNEIHKQRLVGALILLALGVVFWPIIFVQPDRVAIADISDIPPKPGATASVISPPSDAGLRPSRRPIPATDAEAPRDDAREMSSATIEAETSGDMREQHAARNVPPQALAMDEEGIPIAWTLQVATLSRKEAADKLLKQLLADEYKAYITEISRDNKTLYRVCVGPRFEKLPLQRLKPAVDDRYNVTSLIARYIP